MAESLPTQSERETCHAEVDRNGTADACGAPATGVAFHEGDLYPACNRHRMNSARLLEAWGAERKWSHL